MSITQPVCAFVALGTQHRMHMGHIVVCGLVRSTVFSTLSHKQHDLKKLNTKCVFRVSLKLLSEIFFILRRTARDMIENVHWSSCKVPNIFVHFNDTCNFSTDFRKYSNIKFHENLSSGSRIFPYGRTYMTKLKVASRNFAKAPKNGNTIIPMCIWGLCTQVMKLSLMPYASCVTRCYQTL